jgi:uncharacterized repeat protein (TIGR03803 family)
MTFLFALGLGAFAQAQKFKVLYSFTGGVDGANPYAGVIQDSAGHLYATAAYSGNLNCESGYGCGVVYELNTAGRETVLHTFSGPDGELPFAPLVQDESGNLYGTTHLGGSAGYGTVFKIDTAGHETLLYSFTGGSDGCYPYQGLIVDTSGTVFGTAELCGVGYGTIFKVNRAGKFTLLHSFDWGNGDPAYPAFGHLVVGESGNLYGVAYAYGGSYECGALYQLSTSGTLTELHDFGGYQADGCNPYGSVVQDKAGNFYGTTRGYGAYFYGTVWKLTKAGQETILHNFVGGKSDGCDPYGGVALDSKGNLYGVAEACGAYGNGALYKLSAKGKLTILHSFDWSEGAYPYGEVGRTVNGTLFGTTALGGTYGAGTVWSYVP